MSESPNVMSYLAPHSYYYVYIFFGSTNCLVGNISYYQLLIG